MSKRLEEIKQLAISHVTHYDNGEFANLIELAVSNGTDIHNAIINTYKHFPITSGKPSINALVELENFASSRYEKLNLARIRQSVTTTMNGSESDVLAGYLTVINMMAFEEAILSAVREVRENGSATGRA